MMKINLYDYHEAGLAELLAGWGVSAFYTGRVWAYLYRQQVETVEQMGLLRPEHLRSLQEKATLGHLLPSLEQHSQDGTRKFLLALADGQPIETVLMPYRDRYTACVSTQVGCAMGCVFCATGQMGFIRHLTAGEIVAQVLYLLRQQPQGLRNIVLMGMGEPLHNYEATMTAIDILTSHKGLAIAPRHITVSTVGLVPAIKRLADESRPVQLAISLHAATDEERNTLLPIARKWPLAALLEACHYYVARRQKRIFFEWAMISGRNDTPAQAHALGQLLHGLDAHLNLIPLNPTNKYAEQPSQPAALGQFQAILATYGLPSTIRQRRGLDIDAGCGQLRQRL